VRPSQAAASAQQDEQAADRQQLRRKAYVRCEIEDEGERQEDRRRLRDAPADAVLVLRLPAGRGEHQREDGEDAEAERQALRSHPATDPSHLVEERAEQGQQRHARPAALRRHVEDAGVEQQQIAEETERPIGAAREQERGEKSSDERQHGGDLGLVAPGERAARRRNGGHEHEAGREPDQLVADARRPEGGVEDDETAAGERVRRARIAPAQRQLRSGHAGDANHRAQHDTQPRRKQPVLDGVLEEEEAGEPERDRAHDGGGAHAEQLLPVDARRRCRGCWWWWLWRSRRHGRWRPHRGSRWWRLGAGRRH
jgi:hypothetical protein